MHGQAGQQLRQRQVFFGFQDAGYRVQVFVEDAIGAGALSLHVDVGSNLFMLTPISIP